MHFTTPLVVLSGAAVALAGSFPAAPVAAGGHHHLALRQATRDQILRRQRDSMHKVRRQNASPVPNLCASSAPANFILEFADIAAPPTPEVPDMTAFNGQYLFLADDESIQPVATAAEASPYSLSGSSCNLNAQGQLLNTGSGAEFDTVYMSSAADIASQGWVPGTCAANDADESISCTVGDADTFILCTTDDRSTYFLAISSLAISTNTVNCNPVTVKYTAI